ncbi:hypothetical protein PHYSODRAFT_337450 [Phytophthora sojae]|uniref:Uncharacterized protein n=1 Tax=Phytophthora sojae (strain P6497) TaxID=1094619 RepID=G5A168_PHYSP|nr:hypothetical protein PHYSODRAFT_337450 [Phytophthora sojae]EGZ10669.1 hypothetical protein PHYSODRAFT_337450 [Phytophthora sojae]|eukprot:XP_009533414.1 hypothetical protein PHYSODRAFT_337450 [Phytophthora sojae]
MIEELRAILSRRQDQAQKHEIKAQNDKIQGQDHKIKAHGGDIKALKYTVNDQDGEIAKLGTKIARLQADKRQHAIKADNAKIAKLEVNLEMTAKDTHALQYKL